MPTRNSRLAICMHEAGHAIVQLADPPSPWIDWISVDGLGGNALGWVETPSLWQPYMTAEADPAMREQWTALARRDVIFYLAGPIAEFRWRRYPRAAIWLGADQMADRCLGTTEPDPDSDLGRVRRRLTCAVEGDDRVNFIQAWLDAEERVARLWPQIQRLGRALNERGRMDDRELLVFWSRIDADRPASGTTPTGRMSQ